MRSDVMFLKLVGAFPCESVSECVKRWIIKSVVHVSKTS